MGLVDEILECNARLATQNLDGEQRAALRAARRARVSQIKTHFRSGMDLTSDERDLLLTSLFHLRIDHAEDDEKGAQIEALVVKLGGDPEAVFFGGYAASLGSAPVPSHLFNDAPTRDD